MWVSATFGKRIINYDAIKTSSIKDKDLWLEEFYQFGIFLSMIKNQRWTRNINLGKFLKIIWNYKEFTSFFSEILWIFEVLLSVINCKI